MKQFTEKDTEGYYDKEDKVYLSFWDPNGTLHWGLFQGNEDVISASHNLTRYMIQKAKLSKKSVVLDVGCGDGEVDINLVKTLGCDVTGVDLSGIRIKNAKHKIIPYLKNKIRFVKASATNLPFVNETFSQIISQSTIYHIHNKEKAISEIFRVLQKGGLFVFDDVVKPKKQISRDAQKFVYERLFFDTHYSFTTYQGELKRQGFKIIEASDESHNMKKTYEKLCKILETKIKKAENPEFHKRYKYLIKAYQKTMEAVDKNEVGWAIYVCQKLSSKR